VSCVWLAGAVRHLRAWPLLSGYWYCCIGCWRAEAEAAHFDSGAGPTASPHRAGFASRSVVCAPRRQASAAVSVSRTCDATANRLTVRVSAAIYKVKVKVSFVIRMYEIPCQGLGNGQHYTCPPFRDGSAGLPRSAISHSHTADISTCDLRPLLAGALVLEEQNTTYIYIYVCVL
jgi:hypothetical protein